MNAPTMKAVTCTKYGSPDVLKIAEFAQPSPKANEVLVKIHASAATTADTMLRKGTPFYARFFLGLNKPKKPIIGTGFAGEIIAVGSTVTAFKIGDTIFGETALQFSANAEFVCVPENGVITKIFKNMTFEEAAPICDGPLTSLNFLRNLANIQAGHTILINGASGSLGTAAIQLAKYFGARVTAVCSAKNEELVRSLGADEVIDYTTTDFTEVSQQFDFVYDTIGTSSFSKCKAILAPKGQYLSPVLSMSLLFQVLWTSIIGGKRAKFDATGMRPVKELRQMLADLKPLFEKGHLKMIMDKTYPLLQAVEAHRYVDSGRKRGNIVLIA